MRCKFEMAKKGVILYLVLANLIFFSKLWEKSKNSEMEAVLNLADVIPKALHS